MDSSDAGPSQQLHHASSHKTLTSQVLDAQNQNQNQNHNIHAPIPRHPFNLSFPTLNDDGSIPDLTAHQSKHHHYPPTPPAALSSLGIRRKMAEGHGATSESGSSFADSQYDMMDDLSDVSNDDHDTASIASHDALSGQLTPEYAESEAANTDAEDVEEETEQLEHVEVPAFSPAGESFVTLPSPSPSPSQTSTSQSKQQKAENDLIDSYTSEDLETPRQSSMPNAFASTYHLSQRKSADRAIKAVPIDSAVNHILFFSDRDLNVVDTNLLCARVALHMDSAEPGSAPKYQVKHFATPPSGIQEHAKVIRGDSVSATFQHCIGAEKRESSSYKLLILDSDEEHSSFFTVGHDAKIDLQPPKLAVFYLDQFTHGMAWIDTAYSAMQSLKVPCLIIRDSDLSAAKQATIGHGKGESPLTLESKHFLDGTDHAEVNTSIARLIGQGSQVPPPSRISKFKAGVKARWTDNRFFIGYLLVSLLALPICLQWATNLRAAVMPSADLAVRREALAFALDNLAVAENITKPFNIEHLMPPPPTNCSQSSYFGMPLGVSSCPVQAHAQDAPPNHVIFSLQNGPREPRLISVGASRTDGQTLSVEQTKLVPGVYHIALDPNEAYGSVNFNIMTTRPVHNISWTHNFGNRLLQRKTYERASTDLSKIVSKDVAVMRHAAKGITEKVTTEIGAGLWATKNVTSQLALYVTRDIQLAADTAVSVFVSAAKASNKTASNWSKDLVLMQKGVAQFGEKCSENLAKSFRSVKSNSKALINVPLEITKQRLALSKQRLHDLKKALRRSSAKVPTLPKKNNEKGSLLDKFENSLAATPENELSGKHKRKIARQFKADNLERTKKDYEVLRAQVREREQLEDELKQLRAQYEKLADMQQKLKQKKQRV